MAIELNLLINPKICSVLSAKISRMQLFGKIYPPITMLCFYTRG